MTGKEKCEFLKEIRKTMAKENGITYVPRECHHEGECSGTCPLCEKEAAELLAELKKKVLTGEEIQVDNEAIELLERISDGYNEWDFEDNQPELLGDIPSGYFDRLSLTDEEKRIEEERLHREAIEREIERLKKEKQYNKRGIWNAVKRKIRDYLKPPLQGEIIDKIENEPEGITDDKTRLMGEITTVLRCPNDSESKEEHEPDIVWNMDDDENPVVSPSANIKNNDVESKEEDE